MRGLKLSTINHISGSLIVASFTDAWIETCTVIFLTKPAVVASFTDAWIETPKIQHKLYITPSHLLQMRGLKHEGKIEKAITLSHLLQMRGLKPFSKT